MPVFEAFVGGTYRALSPTLAADQAINVYLETRDGEAAKTRVLYGTPGLDLDATAGTVSGRGWFTQDGRTFTVIGATLYEQTAAATYTSRGTILNDGSRVSFASNGQAGNQLAIVGGGELKVLDLLLNTLSDPIVLPFSDPVQITFIDGYGLIAQANTATFWFSALEDFETWDALDFVTRSGTSDQLVGLTVTRDRVWFLGSATSTLYYDSGDADTPFVPYPGTTIQMGLVNPWAFTVYQDVVMWIGQSPSGQARVVKATDPQTQRISTAPIDLFLNRCSTLSDAEVDFYEQKGHPHFLMTCPSSPDDVQTYGFDLRETEWHARASLEPVSGNYRRWRVRGIIVGVDGVVYGTDATTGAIYILNLQTYSENGAILKRERTAPYLGNENQWAFLDSLELGAQVGVGLSTGQGSAPVAELQISRDAAQTWVSAGFATLGAMGGYLARTIWRRLGRARLDRLVLRVIQTDPVACVWTGIWVNISQGTGQL